MANAVQTAPQKIEETVDGELVTVGTPEHAVLSQVFDIGKKYVFQLAEENPEREQAVWNMRTNRPAERLKFKPYRNIVMTSQIIWKGQRRMIRYYDGCDTIFVDKQPKDKETIDQFIRQSKKYAFLDGKTAYFGDERMLLLYLNICSWNVDSPFRTKTADGIFMATNQEKIATQEAIKLDQTEKALELAKSASENKMRIHANYLGIALIDFDSGNDLTEKEIRTEYRKEALRNSAVFIETFGNKSIEAKYFIDKALGDGTISNKLNPNKAAWKSGTIICDVSGLKSHDAISQKLFEFSQTEEGGEFLIQLKAVNE